MQWYKLKWTLRRAYIYNHQIKGGVQWFRVHGQGGSPLAETVSVSGHFLLKRAAPGKTVTMRALMAN